MDGHGGLQAAQDANRLYTEETAEVGDVPLRTLAPEQSSSSDPSIPPFSFLFYFFICLAIHRISELFKMILETAYSPCFGLNCGPLPPTHRHACSLSHVQLFETPQTVAYQASMAVGFSRLDH